MKKLISLFTVFIALLGLTVTGCKLGLDENNVSDKVSITLSKNSLVFNSAIAERTSEVLTAVVENSDAKVIWGSQNTSVAAVYAEGDGRKAKVLVKGEGSTKIVAYTENNKAIAYCDVDVQLTKVACDPVADLSATDATGSSVVLEWTDSKNLTSVRVDVYKDSDLVTTVTVPRGDETVEIKRLKRKTTYTFNVYGVMNGKLSSVLSTTKATVDDRQAPDDVKNVKAKTTDHSIIVSWLPPDDDDINKIYFTAKNLKNIDGSARENVTKTFAYNQLQEVTIENLKADTDYDVEIVTEDISGNKQTVPYKETVSTIADVTPTAKVTVLKAFNLGDYIRLTWNDPEDVDFHNIKIVAEGLTIPLIAKETKKVELNNAEHGATFGTLYNFKVYAVDYDGNDSQAAECSLNYQNISPVTVVNAESYYTNGVKVTWTKTNADQYEVSLCKKEDAAVIKSIEVFNQSSAVFSDLENNVEYYATVKATGQSISAPVAQTESVKTEKVIWRIANAYTGDGNNARYNFGVNKDAKDIVTKTEGNLSGLDYYMFMVYPAKDGSDGFSLQAVKDKNGEETNLWVFIDFAKKIEFDLNSSGQGGRPHAFVGQIGEDKDFNDPSWCSFHWSERTGCSKALTGFSSVDFTGWYLMICNYKDDQTGDSKFYAMYDTWNKDSAMVLGSESDTRNETNFAYSVVE